MVKNYKGVKKRLNMRMKTMNLDIKKECNNVMVIVPHQDDWECIYIAIYLRKKK